MIIFDRVTMTTSVRVGTVTETRTVFSSASLVIPSNRRVALFGSSKEDKRTLINLLSGLVLPRAGRIVRKVKVSFPVGHLGGFVPELPVRVNVAHLARLYEADVKTMVNFVESIAGLGPSFDEPYGLLPSRAKTHLGRIVAYTIPFDVYVLTEQITHGKKMKEDVSFSLFEARSRTAGMIIPVHSPKFARDFCEMGIVLDRGKLMLYEQVEHAIQVFTRINS